jgi:hypothetical protein
MGEALSRLLQVIRFQHSGYVWLDLNDRATGDALLFVVVTRFLLLLGTGWSVLGLTTSARGLEVLFLVTINAVVFWLAYAGLAYAVVRFLFQAGANYAVFLRMTGFAYPTLLLIIFTDGLGLPGVAAVTLGAVWFLAIMARGITWESDLPMERAAIVVVLAFAAWVILASIFDRGGLI